jgi:hypothetical protein
MNRTEKMVLSGGMVVGGNLLPQMQRPDEEGIGEARRETSATSNLESHDIL